MARRNGRPGDYLASDDYTGFTHFRSALKFDYWGALVRKPLQRNLQEIASPLNDPHPVNPFRGSTYEASNGCIADLAPTYVGNTTVPTNPNSAAIQALHLINPAIPYMSVGCTFEVQ